MIQEKSNFTAQVCYPNVTVMFTSTTSVTQVWKSPDISKANCITNSRQQIFHFSAPAFSFLRCAHVELMSEQ